MSVFYFPACSSPAIGNPLYLKSKYGTGYQLNMSVPKEQSAAAIDIVSKVTNTPSLLSLKPTYAFLQPIYL